MAEKSVINAAESGDKLKTLLALRLKLATTLENTTSARDIPPLARQLREVIDEIADLTGTSAIGDTVSVLAQIREKHEKRDKTE